MKKLRHLLEYALLRPLLALIDCLSLSDAERLMNAIADICFAGAARRRDITCDNVRRSGIAKDEMEVRRIAKHSFRHFLCLIVDSLKSDKYFSDETWRDRVELDVSK